MLYPLGDTKVNGYKTCNDELLPEKMEDIKVLNYAAVM